MQRGRSGSMYDNGYKVKKGCCSWAHHDHQTLQEGDLVAAGFSWPPRSYTCSFCKREFRSAQALGGHMNVHRRDRARLRQSPTREEGQFSLRIPDLEPSTNFNSNPNSSPSYFPASIFTKSPNFNHPMAADPTDSITSGQERMIAVRPLTRDLIKMKAPRGLLPVEKYDAASAGVKDYDVLEKAEFVRLELEIGLISESKEELDLELRLGYTN